MLSMPKLLPAPFIDFPASNHILSTLFVIDFKSLVFDGGTAIVRSKNLDQIFGSILRGCAWVGEADPTQYRIIYLHTLKLGKHFSVTVPDYNHIISIIDNISIYN